MPHKPRGPSATPPSGTQDQNRAYAARITVPGSFLSQDRNPFDATMLVKRRCGFLKGPSEQHIPEAARLVWTFLTDHLSREVVMELRHLAMEALEMHCICENCRNYIRETKNLATETHIVRGICRSCEPTPDLD